jgi:alanine dehydrogenase
MRIGIPREIKDGERRVALTPHGVKALRGNQVVFEPGAGAGAGFADSGYEKSGATPGDPWECELVVKVKELQPPEYARARRGQTVLGFQHFGPHPALLDAALASGGSFIAYETVGEALGRLPILAPMSAIAGRLAVQAGAWLLQAQNGGSGVLLPGLDGVAPGRVAILGAGNVGSNALAVACGLGAAVTLFARSERRFPSLRKRFSTARFSTRIETQILVEADLLIGAVLTPGQMSPKLVTRGMLRRMRPGSVLVDVGIDQGGIAETSRPTSHSKPTYVEEGVVHYCVPNLPAACPRTASLALERVVLPYVKKIVHGMKDPDLATGIQVHAGKVTHEKLARDTARAYSPA